MNTAFQCIKPQQATDLIAQAISGNKPLALFDCRDADSYANTHIRGADHLTDRNLGEYIASLPKNTPIMIYCYHGHASQSYAKMFADFRFTEVYSVDGGYEHLRPLVEA